MSRKSKRRIVSGVAILAMSLRLLVGFLFVPGIVVPGTPAEAGFQVVLCTEHGAMQVALDPQGDAQSSQDQRDQVPPSCPYCYAGTGFSFALIPPATGPPLAIAHLQLEPPALLELPLFTRVLVATARGPPSASHLST